MTNKAKQREEVVVADIGLITAPSSLAFSVDLEEWFQVGAFENVFRRTDWPSLEFRVEKQVAALLPLLSEMGVKATFFCLGWVAERFPKVIQLIASSGHEIACHGMDHRRLFTMTQAEFRVDIRRAKDLLEQAAGRSLCGYRAPSFSLTPDIGWVYDELAEAGFLYSSSVYPVKTDHYGSRHAPRTPYYPSASCPVLEIPLTVCDLPFRRVPASGGGYFRLMPYALAKYLFAKAATQTQAPGIYYMHPWEMDLGQPYVRQAPLLSRFRHYVGQKALPGKLLKLSRDHNCFRMDELYQPLFSHTVQEKQ